MSPQRLVAHRKIQDYSENPTYDKLIRTLEIGDIILTCDATSPLRPIVAFQNRFQFPPAARKFTHVAIYLGHGDIVHSMPQLDMDRLLAGGVKRESLRILLPEGTTFAAIRYPGFTEEHRSLVAEAASVHIGRPYDYASIMRCLSFMPRWWLRFRRAVHIGNPVKHPARSFVCSDFVYVVFDELFQHKNPCNYRGGNPGPIFMPCSFFANPNFVDVDIDAE